ncbi:MAG: DUF1857 family protein [Burkholderiaceae bacterium]|nr:DUF1857 family protein [Burkholderiaceae bacterium]
MEFHHIVEVNDPLNPLIETLSREQLWRGLVLRAESPGMFMPHLDRCELGERSPSSVERTLHYGAVAIRDTVVYFPQERVEFRVPAQGEIPASSLVVSILEPQEGMLAVRFDYGDGATGGAGSMDSFYNEFRHSAYKEADLDTISKIRQLAEAGKLG